MANLSIKTLVGDCKMPRLNYFLDRKQMNSTDTLHITHYQRGSISLNETVSLMAEIGRVIKTHGGWPGAFQLTDAGKGSAK